MIRLVIIADDFTGALDTGVKLSESGIRTLVTTKLAEDISSYDTDVLVVDTESRHLSPEEAYEAVFSVAKQFADQPDVLVFKKTDSGLRGNIGAELTAAMRGLGEEKLAFVPGYPAIGRITRGGVHYIDGKPVAESVFGIDLLNPVRFSRVDEIIADQSDEVVVSRSTKDLSVSAWGISVFDAETEADMHNIILSLKKQGVRLMSGCAGAGAYLPEILTIPEAERPVPDLEEPLFAICGSINPVTVGQVDWARTHGFNHFRLSPKQKLNEAFWESPDGQKMLEQFKALILEKKPAVVDAMDNGENQETVRVGKVMGLTVDEIRRRISRTLAALFAQLFSADNAGTLMIIGGDTLQECMTKIGIHEMEPVSEMSQGVVLARFSSGGKEKYILTKSGGFGEESLLTDLSEQIKKVEGK